MDPRRRPQKRLSSTTDLAATSTQGHPLPTRPSSRPTETSAQPSGKFLSNFIFLDVQLLLI